MRPTKKNDCKKSMSVRRYCIVIFLIFVDQFVAKIVTVILWSILTPKTIYVQSLQK